jgi:mRNA interferase MazF
LNRGDIWWADLPPPGGRRPVVLLSRSAAYAIRELITVAPVSRTIRGIPVEVPLGTEDGLPVNCAANLDSITTIPKRTLERQISSLRREKVKALDEALIFALSIEMS